MPQAVRAPDPDPRPFQGPDAGPHHGPDAGPHQGPSTLVRYEALDRIAAEGLSDMVRLVADLCEVERCVLGLYDATPGLVRTLVGVAQEEAPSYAPLLMYAPPEDGLVVVPDALAVPVLALDPLVAGGAVRFFARVPVRGEGGAWLGVLGLFDPSPRGLPDRAAAAFMGLARQIGVQLDLRGRVDSVREKHIEHLDALHVLAGLLHAAITLAIIGTDPAGRITTFSEGAERLLDVPAAQVVARASPVVFLDPGELEACVREATRVLGRRVTGFEALVATSGAGKSERAWTMRRPTGATFPASVVVGPVEGERGEFGGYVVIAQDLTERRAIERMKDEFIGAVSHELRTPLTSMLGALGLVKGGVAGEVSPGVAELVDIAHANGERLLRLVNDLLDAQKLASGRFDLQLAPCDPADVVARAIELTLPLAETAGVQLGTAEGAWEMGRSSAPPSEPGVAHRSSAPPGGAPSLGRGVRVLADFDRLVQVIVNLLSNAIKFSPPGAQVTVGCARRGDTVRISVADRGPGIPESFRDRIFGRFLQASVSDATTRRGTGLGLSIARSIVELHGGTIGFETETGKGTTFHADLPVLL